MTTAIESNSVPTGEVPGMFDLVLKDPERLDELILDETTVVGVIERLLALSVLGLVLTGVSVGIAYEVLGGGVLPFDFGGQPLLWMPPTMVAAFLGALCICLPSFYFYTLLSGIDASFRIVTAQALRTQATTSVLLLATLPIYLAVVLMQIVLGANGATSVAFGMCMPFVVGVFGIGGVYMSFTRIVGRMHKTHQRRAGFIKRLIVCWGAVYTFVAPVALVRIGQALSGVL